MFHLNLDVFGVIAIAFMLFALIIFFASGRDPRSLREVARLLPRWWRD